MPYKLLLAFLAFSIISCSQFSPPIFLAPDCIAAPISYQGTKYYVGRCGNDRTIVQYKVTSGENYRAIWTDGASIPVYYIEQDGVWRKLGAKEADPPPVPDEIIEK